jgi:hypothetical protein
MCFQWLKYSLEGFEKSYLKVQNVLQLILEWLWILEGMYFLYNTQWYETLNTTLYISISWCSSMAGFKLLIAPPRTTSGVTSYYELFPRSFPISSSLSRLNLSVSLPTLACQSTGCKISLLEVSMCRPCLYTAHVYRDDVTLNLGRYYFYGSSPAAFPFPLPFLA